MPGSRLLFVWFIMNDDNTFQAGVVAPFHGGLTLRSGGKLVPQGQSWLVGVFRSSKPRERLQVRVSGLGELPGMGRSGPW